MSESNSWSNPPELSHEDQFLAALNKMPPRDGVIWVVMAILTKVHGNEKCHKQVSRSHFVDMALKLLQGIKHTAEMEVMGFLFEQFAKFPDEKISKEELLTTFAGAGQMAQKASMKSLNEGQKLASLIEGL